MACSRSRQGAPFTIDATGRFPRRRIAQSWSLRERPTTPEIEAAIARSWLARQRSAAGSQCVLFDGELARLVDFKATLQTDGSATELNLELAPTCYREFVGTNMENTALVLRENPDALANPLGTSSVVITSDGSLALGRRSDRVAHHAGFVHTFGGMLEAADRREEGGYDVFGSAIRELREELDLRDNEIIDIVATGIVRDRSLLQPELLFEAELRLTRDQLVQRFDPRLSDGEHTRIELLDDQAAAVASFLHDVGPIAPVAQAALLLYGRRRWGNEWYERTCRMLYGGCPRASGSTTE